MAHEALHAAAEWMQGEMQSDTQSGGMGGMGGGGGGYVAQGSYYSEDGNWMWNGSEWVPAR